MKRYALILVILLFIFTVLVSCSNNSSVENEENITSSQNEDSSKDSNIEIEKNTTPDNEDQDNSTFQNDSQDNLASKNEDKKKETNVSSKQPLASSASSTSKTEKSKAEKSQTIKNTNANSKESSPINSKNESNQNTDSKNNEVYTSPLGFSLSFPASWKGLYTITEDDTSLSVYFKQINEGNYGQGLLFTIQKKTDDFDESLLDSIGSKRYIVAKDILYVIGGPTDVNFSPDSPDFSTFQSMHDQSADVIDTIKIIN